MATFGAVQTRAAELIGESSASATLKNHILAAVRDIANFHNFSWLVKSGSLTLSAGTANLPTDYNPKWGLLDARIVSAGDGNDSIFRAIPLEDRDAYTADDYIYWITWDTSTSRYIFNTKTQSGTVAIYYHHIPADASLSADVLVVPDGEAVAYLAAAKNWVGDERNASLKAIYDQEASSRIQDLKVKDMSYAGEMIRVRSVIDYNPRLRRGERNAFPTSS